MRLCLTLVILPLVLAADWPQFRGPARTGISTEKGLTTTFGKDGPPVVWKIDTLGRGYSAPAVVGDTIYILGSDDQSEYLLALDAATGKKRFETLLGELYTNPWGGGPRGTPTVDGERVYALGAKGGLVCADAKTGKTLWRVDLVADLGGVLKTYAYPNWGFVESPLVDEKHVYVTPGGPKGTLAALDKKTGKVVWRSSDWTDEIDYVSPIKHTLDGKEMLIQMTAAHVAGVSPADGKILWKFPREAKITISSPLAKGNLVFVASSYTVGCDLIRLTPKDDGTFEAKAVYEDATRKAMQNHHGGLILLDGYVYGYSDSRGWSCLKLETGEVAWKSMKLGKGSVVYAEGHLFCYAEEDGTLAVIEASPKGYNEKARWRIAQPSKLPRPERNKSNVWAHPVIAHGKLYLRDQESLVCYDLKGK
ncbi:MAG: PQQ-binding-like beta-propeller repeat protein [Gemmataceae bacterium]